MSKVTEEIKEEVVEEVVDTEAIVDTKPNIAAKAFDFVKKHKWALLAGVVGIGVGVVAKSATKHSESVLDVEDVIDGIEEVDVTEF